MHEATFGGHRYTVTLRESPSSAEDAKEWHPVPLKCPFDMWEYQSAFNLHVDFAEPVVGKMLMVVMDAQTKNGQRFLSC